MPHIGHYTLKKQEMPAEWCWL